MASTLLAVDDSVTMRKVLEITFTGSDFNVVTASSPDAALTALKASKPDLVIADVTLEPKNGYDLCKAIKQASPGTPVLILSSKQNPYDAAKGGAAQADDHMDKPFDTQQMIDKVRKLLQSRGDVAAAAPAPAPAAAAHAPLQQTVTRPAMPAVQPHAPTPQAAAAAPAAATAAPAAQRAKTLIYQPPVGGGPAHPPTAPAPAAARPAPAPAARLDAPQAPTPVTGVPLQKPTSPAPAASAGPAAAVAAAHVNGQMAGKLEGMGLSPAQVDAVLALSRELVERVVWEVVPVLAETIIKEEIARLTK